MFCECGTGSFKYVDGDPEEVDPGCGGGSPSPTRGRRKHGGGAGKVNPFAGRGLDRFSDVLAELEARRASILRRVGGGSGGDAGLVLVRFSVQSNGGWTPVVVKLPEQPLKGKGAAAKKSPRAAAAPPASASRAASPSDPASPREREGGKKSYPAAARVPARKASFSWGRVRRAWRPSWYLPVAVVLTLVSLAVFGRVFAICLTSIWWYAIPTLAGGEDARRAGLRRSMEKKKLVSLQSRAKNGSSWGVHEVASSPRGGHVKEKRANRSTQEWRAARLHVNK